MWISKSSFFYFLVFFYCDKKRYSNKKRSKSIIVLRSYSISCMFHVNLKCILLLGEVFCVYLIGTIGLYCSSSLFLYWSSLYITQNVYIFVEYYCRTVLLPSILSIFTSYLRALTFDAYI